MQEIGIIGFGNMGSAIAERIKAKYSVWVFDKDKNKTIGLSGINIVENILRLLSKVSVVIFAVKPQDFNQVLEEIKRQAKGKLFISIAAGITTSYIEKYLGTVRIVRTMPNMPARIGQGMICLCKGKFATEGDLNFTQQLFDNLGQTLVLKEDMLDEATAISGSGPGYLYDWSEGKDIEEIKKYAQDIFMPSLAASARAIGFTVEQANLLARVTAEGSIAFLEKSNLLPAQLKKQITSKGGTTEAALEVLHKGGSLEEAVKAALNRAKELSH